MSKTIIVDATTLTNLASAAPANLISGQTQFNFTSLAFPSKSARLAVTNDVCVSILAVMNG